MGTKKNRDHRHHHVDASKPSKSSVFRVSGVDCVRAGGGRVVFLVFRRRKSRIAGNRGDGSTNEFEASHFNRYSRCIRVGGHDGCFSWIWDRFAIPGGGGRRRVTWHPKRRGFEHRVTNDSWIRERASSVSLFRGELFEV